jgi:hypothetical protein
MEAFSHNVIKQSHWPPNEASKSRKNSSYIIKKKDL